MTVLSSPRLLNKAKQQVMLSIWWPCLLIWSQDQSPNERASLIGSLGPTVDWLAGDEAGASYQSLTGNSPQCSTLVTITSRWKCKYTSSSTLLSPKLRQNAKIIIMNMIFSQIIDRTRCHAEIKSGVPALTICHWPFTLALRVTVSGPCLSWRMIGDWLIRQELTTLLRD